MPSYTVLQMASNLTLVTLVMQPQQSGMALNIERAQFATSLLTAILSILAFFATDLGTSLPRSLKALQIFMLSSILIYCILTALFVDLRCIEPVAELIFLPHISISHFGIALIRLVLIKYRGKTASFTAGIVLLFCSIFLTLHLFGMEICPVEIIKEKVFWTTSVIVFVVSFLALAVETILVIYCFKKIIGNTESRMRLEAVVTVRRIETFAQSPLFIIFVVYCAISIAVGMWSHLTKAHPLFGVDKANFFLRIIRIISHSQITSLYCILHVLTAFVQVFSVRRFKRKYFQALRIIGALNGRGGEEESLEMGEVSPQIAEICDELGIPATPEPENSVEAITARSVELQPHHSRAETLESESRAKEEAIRVKKKLEQDINELEIGLDHANRANADAPRTIKKHVESVRELQLLVEEEQRQGEELREQFVASEKRAQLLQLEKEAAILQAEGAEHARRNAETELIEKREQYNDMANQLSTVNGGKRKLEGELQSMTIELDKALDQLKTSDELGKKAAGPGARRAEPDEEPADPTCRPSCPILADWVPRVHQSGAAPQPKGKRGKSKVAVAVKTKKKGAARLDLATLAKIGCDTDEGWTPVERLPPDWNN